ncbi:MAG TPA: YeeE/YedE thiosulfate transporter family protein, partial [Kofleriaceae bacterium]|nr:YeeE/YedE thiosulfate transporter family protein [Kofleriaceae bacterium]
MSILVPLAGGAIIGLGAAVLYLLSGRIAGVSGILGGALVPRAGETGWRLMFLAGLIGGGAIGALAAPEAYGLPRGSLLLLLAAGVLVGFGTRLGNGCTSGHGVCGVARLSRRSMAATALFIAAGVVS